MIAFLLLLGAALVMVAIMVATGTIWHRASSISPTELAEMETHGLSFPVSGWYYLGHAALFLRKYRRMRTELRKRRLQAKVKAASNGWPPKDGDL